MVMAMVKVPVVWVVWEVQEGLQVVLPFLSPLVFGADFLPTLWVMVPFPEVCFPLTRLGILPALPGLLAALTDPPLSWSMFVGPVFFLFARPRPLAG
jgi:hypothetical protein